MEKRLSDIEKLIIIFNAARKNNVTVDEIAERIGKEVVLYFNEIFYNPALVQKLGEEVSEYIKKKLICAERIESFNDSEYTRDMPVAAIRDNEGNLIFRYEMIDFSFNGCLNEFFRTDDSIHANREIPMYGIALNNAIAYNNKLYIKNPKRYVKYFDDFLRAQDSFICRVYNENGIESINLVDINRDNNYPNYVGTIIKHTEEKEMVLEYFREKQEDECRNGIIHQGKITDVPTIISETKISQKEWKNSVKKSDVLPKEPILQRVKNKANELLKPVIKK